MASSGWRKKPVNKWTAEEVAEWLASNPQLDGARSPLRGIDGQKLAALNSSILISPPYSLTYALSRRIMDALSLKLKTESVIGGLDDLLVSMEDFTTKMPANKKKESSIGSLEAALRNPELDSILDSFATDFALVDDMVAKAKKEEEEEKAKKEMEEKKRREEEERRRQEKEKAEEEAKRMLAEQHAILAKAEAAAAKKLAEEQEAAAAAVEQRRVREEEQKKRDQEEREKAEAAAAAAAEAKRVLLEQQQKEEAEQQQKKLLEEQQQQQQKSVEKVESTPVETIVAEVTEDKPEGRGRTGVVQADVSPMADTKTLEMEAAQALADAQAAEERQRQEEEEKRKAEEEEQRKRREKEEEERRLMLQKRKEEERVVLEKLSALEGDMLEALQKDATRQKEIEERLKRIEQEQKQAQEEEAQRLKKEAEEDKAARDREEVLKQKLMELKKQIEEEKKREADRKAKLAAEKAEREAKQKEEREKKEKEEEEWKKAITLREAEEKARIDELDKEEKALRDELANIKEKYGVSSSKMNVCPPPEVRRTSSMYEADFIAAGTADGTAPKPSMDPEKRRSVEKRKFPSKLPPSPPTGVSAAYCTIRKPSEAKAAVNAAGILSDSPRARSGSGDRSPSPPGGTAYSPDLEARMLTSAGKTSSGSIRLHKPAIIHSLKKAFGYELAISRPNAGSAESEVYRPKLPEIPVHDTVKLMNLIEEGVALPWEAPALIDYWTSLPTPMEDWEEFKRGDLLPDGSYPVPTRDTGLVDPVALNQYYHIESCRSSITKTNPDSDFQRILFTEDDFCYFRHFIFSQNHENYLVPALPAIISMDCRPNCGTIRAIIRTKKETKRILLPAPIPRALKALKVFIPLLKDEKMAKSKNPGLPELLATYEEKNIFTKYKFGVLYTKKDQNDENEIFGNTETSPAYEEFLDFIGTRITLEGWSGYRAGLDVKANQTGTHSVYTLFDNYEIMFHVATMLPYQCGDEQKVERKRHIGNDVVVIIFKEQSSPTDRFHPKTLTSHFNHSFFVISPVLGPDGTTTHYKLTVANKPSVPPFPPFLPDSAIFEKGPKFRDFLLTKLVNAERAAFASPEFTSLINSRKQHLNLMIQQEASVSSK